MGIAIFVDNKLAIELVMLKRLRIILAAICFIAISALFLDFTSTALQHWGWLAKWQFMPAVLSFNVVVLVALVVISLIFGRVYCSVLCPLGVMQDFISWIHDLFGGKRRFRYTDPLTWARIGILALFVALVIFGFMRIASFIEPYSEFGRIMNSLVKPLYVDANNMIADRQAEDVYNFYHVDNYISISLIVVASVTLLVVGLMAWFGGRIYCNSICPVGTILGYLSQFSWLKPVIDTSKCVNCGKCGKLCKASCIDTKNHRIDYTRCVSCMNCLENCSVKAISYTHPGKCVASTGHDEKTVDEGRRKALTVGALLAAGAALKAEDKITDGALAEIIDKKKPIRKTPVTPPGSHSYENFTRRCVSCQLCVSNCPNGVLRPSADASTFMLPEMSYERGYCRPECNNCSQVCPAGAIEPIDLADKSSIQVGHAVWIKESCIAATQGVSCGNCSRHCPVGAIAMVALDPEDENSPKVPAVNTERCIGCGACENLCPVRPLSAIYVEGHKRHRII